MRDTMPRFQRSDMSELFEHGSYRVIRLRKDLQKRPGLVDSLTLSVGVRARVINHVIVGPCNGGRSSLGPSAACEGTFAPVQILRICRGHLRKRYRLAAHRRSRRLVCCERVSSRLVQFQVTESIQAANDSDVNPADQGSRAAEASMKGA